MSPKPTDRSIAHPVESPPAAGRPRVRLSRDLIIDAAIAQIDREGVPALTMRRLGQRLGVEAMSIYHHVNGREDLLEAVVDRLASQARIEPDQVLGPADGWQTYLIELAHSVRAVATDHPHAFPLIATRPPAAPWLRPPLRSLDVVEDFLAAMVSRGLSDENAVHAYKVFASFLLGTLLLEVGQREGVTGPDRVPLDEGEADVPNADHQLSLDDFPQLSRLSPLLAHHDPDVDFADALEVMLDRLDLEMSQ